MSDTVIGIVAGICTSASMVPQLVKMIRERKAGDISLVMLLILLCGLGTWVYYGIRREDYPIIITNSFAFLVNTAIIFLSFFYKK